MPCSFGKFSSLLSFVCLAWEEPGLRGTVAAERAGKGLFLGRRSRGRGGRGLGGGRESPARRAEGRDGRCDPRPAGGTSGISAWRCSCWLHQAEGRCRGATGPCQGGARARQRQAAAWEPGLGGRARARPRVGPVLSPSCSAGEIRSEYPQDPHVSQGAQPRRLLGRLDGEKEALWNLSAFRV